MWVGWIRRCLRRSSTCEGWVSGVRGGVASWYSVYQRGFVCFLGGCCDRCELVWPVEGFLVYFLNGFSLFILGLLGVCLIRDKPARIKIKL